MKELFLETATEAAGKFTGATAVAGIFGALAAAIAALVAGH